MAQNKDLCSLASPFGKAACYKCPQEKTKAIMIPPRTCAPTCGNVWLCQGSTWMPDTTANTLRREGRDTWSASPPPSEPLSYSPQIVSQYTFPSSARKKKKDANHRKNYLNS